MLLQLTRTQIPNSRRMLSAIPLCRSCSSLRAASRVLQLGPPFSTTLSCLSSHASTMLDRYAARVLSIWLVTVVCDSPSSSPSTFSSSLFKGVIYPDTSILSSMSAKKQKVQWYFQIIHTFGTSHFFIERVSSLSSIRPQNVSFIQVFSIVSFIQSVHYHTVLLRHFSNDHQQRIASGTFLRNNFLTSQIYYQ